MAGNQNSGRRGAPRNEDGSFANGSPPRGPASRPAPVLEPSHASCQAVTSWIFEQQVHEAIDNKTAEVMLAAVSKMTASLRAQFPETELEQLRALVNEMKSAVAGRVRQEQQDRFSADAKPAVLGRVRAKSPDGGEPH